MSKFAKNLLRKDVHYLQNANPYKTIESLNSLLDNNLSLCENNNYAILNKPPGFALLDTKKQDTIGLVNVLNENIKKRFGWDKSLRLPLVTNEQSGMAIFANSNENFNELKKTMHTTFSTTNTKFLKFYGITTYIPISPTGKDVINISYKNVDNQVLYFEESEVSNNQLKSNKVIRYQIEHEILSYNESLNVALVQFETTMHSGEGINLYCVKNLFPLLGDQKYSSRVQEIFRKPVLRPNQKETKPKTQELNEKVLNRLHMSKNNTAPLHLHLNEINMPKTFKKQKITMKQSVPLSNYFTETLNRLGLDLPN